MTTTNDSVWSPFFFAFAVTFALYYIVEILNPYVEETRRYESTCQAAGGFVFERQNAEKMCINNNIIIEVK